MSAETAEKVKTYQILVEKVETDSNLVWKSKPTKIWSIKSKHKLSTSTRDADHEEKDNLSIC